MTTRRSMLAFVFGVMLAAGCSSLAADTTDTNPDQTQGSTNSTNGKARKNMMTIPTTPVTVPQGREIATIAGGCFWCVEAILVDLKGVDTVVSGYSGGFVERPSYEAVCSGNTGHAEAVQVVFDPKVIGFADILRVFFTTHDPTTLNRQGADVGTQYRSAIFYHTPEQKTTALNVIAEVNNERIYNAPVVTEVTEFRNFYAAEAYHQNYFAQNPNQGYCRVVIQPKVIKFRQKWQKFLK